MKVIAVYNFKGGVGKTTMAVNLAYLSGIDGARSLIWDLDPQASASFYLCVKPKIEGGARKMVKKKKGLDGHLRMTGYPNLDLLPADISYRHMETFINKEKKPLQAIEKILHPLRKQYDNVILDCPPGLSLVAENVFKSADILLVPMIPTVLSLRAYNALVKFLRKKGPKKLKVIPFFTMVSPYKPMHQTLVDAVPRRNHAFLKSFIPDSTVVESMGVKRAPVPSFARESKAAEAYRTLWKEIKYRAGMRI